MRFGVLKFAFFILPFAVFICPVDAQDSVVVSYDGYAGFQGPLWAAKDLGLFDKYGLKTEMVLITGSTRGMAALISASTDFAQGSASASIPIRLRGGDLTIVAAALEATYDYFRAKIFLSAANRPRWYSQYTRVGERS